MTGRSWLALGLCLLCAVAALWLGLLEPLQRHAQFCRTTRTELEKLAKKRPPGLTPKQWNNVVGWTLQGHGNTLAATQPMPGARRISRAEMRRFESELTHRLNGYVDLATVDWIWDEFERLTPAFGPKYSHEYRPTSSEKLKKFEEEDFTWAGIEVD